MDNKQIIKEHLDTWVRSGSEQQADTLKRHQGFIEMLMDAAREAENLPISGVTLRSGVGLIAQERQRQIEKEGWTPEHDNEHNDGSLAQAAAAYASKIPELWPWEMEWWKPSVDDRVKELAKAGALIAAEIDRIKRAEGNEG